ncbi:MAG: HAD family hydrolase [Methanomicrobiales archaeon]
MTFEGNPRHGQIRAIIFDMDNTLFDFVAAKQHACREVAKFLGRDDWEALFSCFLNSPHGFESHENIKDYFDLCGLLEECSAKQNPGMPGERQDGSPRTCSITGEGCNPGRIRDEEGEERGNFPGEPPSPGKKIPPATSPPHDQRNGQLPSACGGSFTWEVHSTQPSSKETNPVGSGNLLADKSLYCNEVFSRCCTIYEAEKVRVLSPYPGVRETLGELKRRGFPLAIVTDAYNGNALARLRKTDLFDFFDFIISYDMTGAKKPAPDAFLLALKKLETLPSETLLVGDSLRRDIAPAQALGMITAYAAYGDRNVRTGDPPNCRPDYVLTNIEEMVGLV